MIKIINNFEYFSKEKQKILKIMNKCHERNLNVYFTGQGLLYYNKDIPLIYCSELINPNEFNIGQYVSKINSFIDETTNIHYLIDNNNADELYSQFNEYTLQWTPVNYIESLFLDILNYRKNYSDEILSVFREIALDIRFSSSAPSEDFDDKLILLLHHSKPYKHSKIEQTNIPEKLTVYRGESSGSTINGLSWTTDKKIAELFANDFGSPTIKKRDISRKDILAMYKPNYESECLIDYPNRIYNSKTQEFWKSNQ